MGDLRVGRGLVRTVLGAAQEDWGEVKAGQLPTMRQDREPKERG